MFYDRFNLLVKFMVKVRHKYLRSSDNPKEEYKLTSNT